MEWEKLDDKRDGRDSEENVKRKNGSHKTMRQREMVSAPADQFVVAHQKYHYLDDRQSFNINIYEFR